MTIGALLVWMPFMMMLAKSFETAHRLVEVLDEVYPSWGDSPRATMSPEPGPQPANETTTLVGPN